MKVECRLYSIRFCDLFGVEAAKLAAATRTDFENCAIGLRDEGGEDGFEFSSSKYGPFSCVNAGVYDSVPIF